MDLFGRVVPTAVAHRMLNSPEELAPQKVDATVLFCDLARLVPEYQPTPEMLNLVHPIVPPFPPIR
jgi:hypothetical protein